VDEFEDLRQYHGFPVWLGDIREFKQSTFAIFRCNPKYQRRVKCKRCGVVIPKNLPRIKVVGSWDWDAGHYCLSCGLELIRAVVARYKEVKADIEKALTDAHVIIRTVKSAKEREAYKEGIALGKLCVELMR
jgi:Pyruvate/2-oxoacid:ferredoxin oxidoreductase delta subunit